MSIPATLTWRSLLGDLLAQGSEVSPSSAGGDFKGSTTREVLGYQTRWAMPWPSIACPLRKLGYRFMAAEAAWVLGGDNRLETIKPYAKHMARFSDDGRTLSGAYGPPFVEQAAWVARALLNDPASRQAVATIWRPRPGPTSDTPCTVALQWLVRNGRLCCVATMRSSDAWTGIPYDVFTFSMMSAYVSIAIRNLARREADRLTIEERRGRPSCFAPLSYPLGDLILTAGSQHLYKADWEEAAVALAEETFLFEQAAFSVDAYASPQELIDSLWSMAKSSNDPAVSMSLWGRT